MRVCDAQLGSSWGRGELDTYFKKSERMSGKVCFKHLKHARSGARTVTSLGRKIIHCWERTENIAVRAEQNVCVCGGGGGGRKVTLD